MSDRLTHIADSGDAKMVDVSAKAETKRIAQATGVIRMKPETLAAIMTAQVKKGDVLGTARIAAVMSAKRTSDLIPLCHPIALTDVQVELTPDASLPGIRATVSATTIGRTGVEMEALTGVSVALLTIYDMVKAIDRGMVIADISLAYKSGGASGDFSRLDGRDNATYPESAKPG